VRRQGLDTIPELWSLLGDRFTGRWRSRDSRSAAQGGGTVTASLLSRYVLGVRPHTAGFESILIAPQPADLEWAKGVWASPQGAIKVAWHVEESGIFAMDCEVPETVEVLVKIPHRYAQQARIVLNGRRIQLSSKGTARCVRGLDCPIRPCD